MKRERGEKRDAPGGWRGIALSLLFLIFLFSVSLNQFLPSLSLSPSFSFVLSFFGLDLLFL